MLEKVLDVKSKSQVVGQVTVQLPESLKEAMDTIGEAKALDAMHYGLRVKTMNAKRAEVTGGPKSVSRQVAMAIKDNPEAAAKICKILGIDLPTE